MLQENVTILFCYIYCCEISIMTTGDITNYPRIFCQQNSERHFIKYKK